MHSAGHRDDEDQCGISAVAVFQGDVFDICADIGDSRGDRCQHTLLIPYFRANFHRELAVDIRLPGDIHPFFGPVGEIGKVFTRRRVDDDTTPGADESDDAIPRNRPTAFAEIDHHTLGPLDVQRLLHNDPELFDLVNETLAIYDPVERPKALNRLYLRMQDEQLEISIGYVNIPWGVGSRVESWQPYPLAFWLSSYHSIILK